MSAASNPGTVDYLNPEGLHQNPAFSQAVVVTGAVKTIYIGGQNAVNAAGEVVGKGDFAAQSRHVLENIQTCLAAAGAGFEHIIKLNILVARGQSLSEGYAVFQEFFPAGANPPAVTAAFVAGLAHPDFLAEIDAIAIVPA
ncbi:MAG: RidA family protein [Chloroflexota bacterium]|nr:RidA family protein [Chloroflexota bacterium]